MENFAKESNSNRALPETFVGRLSCNELRRQLENSASGSTHAHITAEDCHGDDSGDSTDNLSDGGSIRKRRGGTSPSRDNQGSNEEQSEQNKKQRANILADSLRLLCPLDDVANELDLAGMMNEDDHCRTVREFVAIHVVPRMTGKDPKNLLTHHETEEIDTSLMILSAANLAQHNTFPFVLVI